MQDNVGRYCFQGLNFKRMLVSKHGWHPSLILLIAASMEKLCHCVGHYEDQGMIVSGTKKPRELIELLLQQSSILHNGKIPNVVRLLLLRTLECIVML